MAVGARADHQRQVGHGADRHPVKDNAFAVDQVARPVLPHRRGGPLDDVDHQRVGKAPRDARILDPAEPEQLPRIAATSTSGIDAAFWPMGNGVDHACPLGSIVPGALDLDRADPEARVAGRLADLGGQAERVSGTGPASAAKAPNAQAASRLARSSTARLALVARDGARLSCRAHPARSSSASATIRSHSSP